MRREDALRKFETLTYDGQAAVLAGDLCEYVIAQDTEVFIENVLEDLALADKDDLKHFQNCVGRQDATMLGEVVLSILNRSYLATLEAERGDMCQWAQQEYEAQYPRRHLPFIDDLGDAA